MYRLIVLSFIVCVILTACGNTSPDPVVIAKYINETLVALPKHTAYPSYTPYPTYTSLPTNIPIVVTKLVTPTNTAEPSSTPTPKNTPTPQATAVPLSAYISNPQKVIEILSTPENYKGQFVKFLLQPSGSIFVKNKEIPGYFAVFPNQRTGFDVFPITNDKSDETVDLEKNGFAWAYGAISENIKFKYFKDSAYYTFTLHEMSQILILHQEIIDPLLWPKEDGLYEVNKDIAPGYWIASEDITTDGCYWARINRSGNIIQNHYGVAGITVYISPSDTVVQFDGCGTMYYRDY